MNTQKPLTEPKLDGNGEVMMMAFEKEYQRYRPLIFLGPCDQPDSATKLFVGHWHHSLRAAQREGLKVYFDSYEKQYGFKHPEDPRRRPSDGPLPATVFTMKEGERYRATQTFDQGEEVANVAL